MTIAGSGTLSCNVYVLFTVGEDESVEAKETAAANLISSLYDVERVTSTELKQIKYVLSNLHFS